MFPHAVETASGTHGAPDDAPLAEPDGPTLPLPEPEGFPLGRPETPDELSVPLALVPALLAPVADGLPVLAPLPEGWPLLLLDALGGVLPPPPPDAPEVGGVPAPPELAGMLAS
jgi:hypothetical protein